MHKNSSIFFAFVLLVGDFLAVLSAFVVAYIIRVKFDDRHLVEPISAKTYLLTLLFVLPIWIIVHALIGLYQKSTLMSRIREFTKLSIGSFIGILVVIGADFVTPGNFFPARLVVVYAFVLSFLFLLIFRILARRFHNRLLNRRGGIRVLVIGSGKTSKSMINSIFSDGGYQVIGFVGKNAYLPSGTSTFASLGSAVESIGDNIDSIIQTELFADENRNSEVLEFAQTRHIAYQLIPGNNEIFSGKLEVELLSGMPVISVHPTQLLGWGRIIKRLFDFAVSLLLLIISSPLFILIMLVHKLSEPRSPIFFTQARLTRFNREFKVIKFRSQYEQFDGTTPEQAFQMIGKPELSAKYRANGDYLKNDPRITPLGRLLRATSLDELPQLWNVLKGDISLVGPRALVPQELNKHDQKHMILSVKSGVTGLAQVSGRKDISFDERRRLDLYYVQNWSFWLDIIILLKTIKVVLFQHGAK